MDARALEDSLAEAVVRAADPGGRVMTPEEYREMKDRRQGWARSAGLQVAWKEDRGLYVTGLADESPAGRAGLAAGAVLDSVGGRFVAGRSAKEVLSWLDEGEEETVRVDARLPNAAEVASFDVRRTRLLRPSISAEETWPKDLVYLRLGGLYDDAAPSVAARLREAQESRRFGVILDLRGAGGDRVDAAAALAGLLSERPEGASLVIESLDESSVEEFMAVAGERIRLPAMVLVDRQTRGAAELLAAVLRVVGRGAMLVGEQTGGDCGLREAVPFGDDRLLYVRTRRILLNGDDVCAAIGPDGVEPHIAVRASDPVRSMEAEPPSRRRPSREDEEARETRALRARMGQDAVLQRAVDVLLGLRAVDRRDAAGTGE